MTQVFADDDQVGDRGLLRGGQIPAQAAYRLPSVLGPAMTPGKGVRAVRCVGCSHDTLPRHDDGAPLCQRCSDVLALADATAAASIGWPGITRTPRWLRRRSALD